MDETTFTLARAQIATGRGGVDEQAKAGYLKLTVHDESGTRPRPRLRSPITVDIDAGDGPVRLFTGTIVNCRTAMWQDGAPVRYHLTAAGPLARLHRGRVPDGGYPQQRDGDRVAAVLDTLAIDWTQAGPYSWASFPDRSWIDADPVGVEVDTPGQYLLAGDPEPRDAASVVLQAAQDGLGQLEETRRGAIRYTDAVGRLTRATAGYVDLPTPAPGLEAVQSIGDVVNSVAVEYIDGDQVGVVSARDEQAIADLGGEVLHETVQTRLVNAGDAQGRADRYVGLRSRPAVRVEDLTVHVTGDLDVGMRRAMFELEPGAPVRLRRLPRALGRSLVGFVERLSWTLTGGAATVVLLVSDWRLSEQALTWGGVEDTVGWVTVDGTISWTRAQELTSG
ncbi:hypothetical protein [Egicoccus sp. AB-alg2]|uniref:hypothetical protein n=1 Tax=Egicoccus sp. AB-alg2 TaxID=3242693 RepID=UPI00359D4DE9